MLLYLVDHLFPSNKGPVHYRAPYTLLHLDLDDPTQIRKQVFLLSYPPNCKDQPSNVRLRPILPLILILSQFLLV